MAAASKIHPDDTISLLGWLPKASLSRAFVLFPDPWPKKRHRERRIFSPVLLDRLGRVLRPGAELRFASDIADYAEAAIEHANAHPDFEVVGIFTSSNRATASDWPVTRYEEKASKQGRSSTFISMRRSLSYAARLHLDASCLSYDFFRERGEEEPLGEGCSPLVSGEERLGSGR